MAPSLDIIVGIGKTIAEIVAELTAVPGLVPAVDVFITIIELCKNVKTNRNEARHLRSRCYNLLDATREQEHRVPNSLQNAFDRIKDCLHNVQAKMTEWAGLKFITAFFKQDEVKEDIQRCHENISDCFIKFQLVGTIEAGRWQEDFTKNHEEDQKVILAYLADIENGQEIIRDMLAELKADIAVTVMSALQKILGQLDNREDDLHTGLSSNLYQIQTAYEEILPEMHLKHGEVKRIGMFPAYAKGSMDIYEGIYLTKQKVALKTIRATNANNAKSRARFKREVEIWSKLWKVDKGKYILPFLGYCLEDGPFPYMVSPWKSNRTAIEYVKEYDTYVDYREMITNVARGVQVLHSLRPEPIAHGDLKADNIVIDDQGNPLIADFGLSQVIKDISPASYSQSRMSDSWRWLAPEVCIGEGSLSLEADIHALAMTILELYTHQIPFHHIKLASEVLFKRATGVVPPRPSEERVLQRGLDDDTWKLMTDCWNLEASERPDVDKVLKALEG